MDWLLGAGNIAGIAGLATLGVFLYKTSQRGRSDLKSKIKSLETLADAKERIKDLEHALEDRNAILEEKENELSRVHKAKAEAEKALGHALEKLSKTGTPRVVSDDIRGALSHLARLSGVLQDMPDTEAPTTPKDR